MMDADNLPREGIDSQHIVEGLSMRYRQGNVDGILRNLPQIMRATGARRPVELTNLPSSSEQPQAVEQTQQSMGSEMPPSDGKLRLPQPKMMPGANTEPGKPVSKEDLQAFDAKVGLTTPPPSGLQGFGIPSVSQRAQPRQPAQPRSAEPQFFEDVTGNKYKMVGDKLYVMGWQDAEVKVRMVSEKTGKEVPTTGKKFQIYGWHLVNKVKKSESVEKLKSTPDIDAVEHETSESVKRQTVTAAPPRKSEPNIRVVSVSKNTADEDVKNTEDDKSSDSAVVQKTSSQETVTANSDVSKPNPPKPAPNRKKLI